MACSTREKTNWCSHHQCGYSDQTEHGYQCVDLAEFMSDIYCECGDGCVQECPYSYPHNDTYLRYAVAAFENKYA